MPNHPFGLRSIPPSPADSRYGISRSSRSLSKPAAGTFPAPSPAAAKRSSHRQSRRTPQYLLRLPGPGWPPFLAAILTAAFFLLLTVKAMTLAVLCGMGAIAMILVWMWSSDPQAHGRGRHRRRYQAATYVSGSAFAFLVGDGGCAAGRGLALPLLRLLISLSLDGIAAGVAEARNAAQSVADVVWRATRCERQRGNCSATHGANAKSIAEGLRMRLSR